MKQLAWPSKLRRPAAGRDRAQDVVDQSTSDWKCATAPAFDARQIGRVADARTRSVEGRGSASVCLSVGSQPLRRPSPSRDHLGAAVGGS
jgi:hypothetical protein